MLLLPQNTLFIFLLLAGPIFSLSSSSWLLAWIGLEVNILAILTLLINSSSPRGNEAALNYFLIQTLASSALLASALAAASLSQETSNTTNFSFLIFFSLLTNTGAAPFHFWLPQVIEGLSWNNLYIILTWQNVAPSLLLLNCLETSTNLHPLLPMAAILSALFGGLGGLTQTSARNIISFSSINHLGWALAGLYLNIMLWTIYFSLYSLLLFNILHLANTLNISSTSASLLPSSTLKVAFFLSLLSFGGLPPLLGFFPNWVIIDNLSPLLPSFSLLLALSSLPPLIFYLNLATTSMLNNSKINLNPSSSSAQPIWAIIFNLPAPALAACILL